MVPAESYLDPYRVGFDRSLLHSYQEWDSLHPEFTYHGLNTYAPLLSSDYKQTCVEGKMVDTFDFVTVQLYEGYSHANYAIRVLGHPVADYFLDLIQAITTGWWVNFSQDVQLGIVD